MYRDNGEPTGFGFDIVKACLSEKYELKATEQSINGLFKKLERGSIDINIMSYKTKRAEYVHYASEPIFENSYVPFKKVGKEVLISKISDFDRYSLAHLDGLRTSNEYFEYINNRKKD